MQSIDFLESRANCRQYFRATSRIGQHDKWENREPVGLSIFVSEFEGLHQRTRPGYSAFIEVEP
jgi:hypothetical protein